ncbi:glycine cleavage system protein GcvH [Haladaptatus cibarius]|uniref:glycine cleavage system protein GcvH n=1 Tax=Haladaptatus cibarius TaxID=453847 RepID=UPI0006796070|nr:glycine cleavage system protein GcvH [Haladaptatus cibarius]
MSFKVPNNLHYTVSHEWVERRDEVIRVGITDFAQDELGDIVFVELPEQGAAFKEGEEIGVIESIKAVSDIYAPVSGEIVTVNETVLNEPEYINDEPYQRGWMIEMVADDDLEHLLTPTEYRG